MTDRRLFIQRAALGTAALAWNFRAAAAGARAAIAPANIQTIRLADGLTLFSGAGGNVVALGNAADGVLLVDTGAAEHTGNLLSALSQAHGTQRVTTAFNTHWHWDHTGGNELLAKAGAKIHAHAFTRQWLMTSIFVPWQDRLYARRPAAAVPAVGFYKDGELRHAGHTVAYGHLWQAHTDGDIYVHLPQHNVLIVGDLLSVGRYPVLDYTTGGWIGGLLDANRKLLTLCNADTRIVAASGPVYSKADLQAHHDMLAALRPILVTGIKSGFNGDDMIQRQLTRDFDAAWGDPRLFLQNAYLGLWAHARELGGIV